MCNDSWLHVGQVLSDVASYNYNIQYLYVAALCVPYGGDVIMNGRCCCAK